MSTQGKPTGSKPVIRVQRRRPSGQTSSAGRERAQAPRREGRPDQPTGSPFSSRTSQTQRPSQPVFRGTPSAAGCLPALSRRTLILLGILALLFLCVYGAITLFSGNDEGDTPSNQGLVLPTAIPTTTEEAAPTAIPPTPRPTNVPFVAPTGAATGQSWLVMLYQDADDKVLEKDIYVDLNEAERVGSSDNVRIVAQIDRYSGGFTDDGNWTSTKRFYVTQDNDLQAVGSELVADLGEQNMSDGATLVDFVTWAVQTFPADKLVLILSDHGMGWPGGWSDPAPATRGDNSTPLSSALGNQLYLNELDAALQTIRDRVGGIKFELIGMDACLMGQVEVLSALAPHARYAVTSEETEPGLGWAYASFLQELEQNPSMNGADLGKLIVASYVRDDERIVDDQMRADLLGRSSPMGGLFGGTAPTSAEVARQMERDVTLATVDLSAVPALVDSVNTLCAALQGGNSRSVSQARSYAQSFTSIFGQQVPPAYIDLGSFVQLLKQAGDSASVNQAADGVLAALRQAVVAEKHGAGKPGATGVAIYFPNSQLFDSPVAGPVSYTAIASRFASESLWDDYLTFFYTGRAFDASARQPAVPASGSTVSAPAAGGIQMSPVTLSGTVAAPGQPVLLSTDISGENLGYVLLFAGYYDQQSNSLMVVDMDYLDSSDTRQIDGVYYPVWPTAAFTMQFEWEPLMFYISDGTDSTLALLTPQTYGATPEEAVYTVDGTYTFASGESRVARLYFRNGQLLQVFGFTGASNAGAPSEIYPQTGDTFTVLDHWLDLDAQGQVVRRSTQAGGTLTFHDQMFTWVEMDAAVGDYIVGFIAEDLDGNKQEVYEQVTVQ